MEKKRLIKGVLFIMAVVLFLLSPVLSFAAGTVTPTLKYRDDGVAQLTFTCVADAADGTFPATASNVTNATFVFDGYAVLGVTLPGSTAPTANYDITITDSDGVDVFGGALEDRSATVKEQAFPQDSNGLGGGRFCFGALTLTITNNSVNSADIVIIITIDQ